jgi:lipid-A-disaccharide synthase
METKIKKTSPTTKKSSPKQKKDLFGSPVFVLAGEHSGDLLGGDLLRELTKLSPGTDFYGIGGEEMKAQGMESLEDLENLSVIGFAEVIKKYSYLKNLMETVVSEILKRESKFVILIDYPGFNLRLAERVKSHNIQVIFYVSPQIWAWKFNRIFHIRKNVDLMLTLFQFEEDMYRDYGVNAYFVGHPLPKRIQKSLKTEKPLAIKKDKNSKEMIVGLLPGSRRQEITKLLDPILESAALIHDHFKKTNHPKKLIFLLPNINPKLEDYIKDKITEFITKYPAVEVHYAFQSSSQVMEASDVLLLASGTATLEGVYWEKPMVVLYKVSLFTYFLGSMLIRTENIGLVNILAGKEICRELIQAECTPELISREAIAILEDPIYKKRITSEVIRVKNRELSETDGAKRASRTIIDYVKLFLSNQTD